jgi:CheY-like chemotaxis protein
VFTLRWVKIWSAPADAVYGKARIVMGERILVVEDSAVDRSILVKRLQSAGFEVTSAVDGSEAIRAVTAVKPHLMILDLTLLTDDWWNTPLRDGFTTLEWLRRVHPAAAFPVIVHTSSPLESIAAKAQATGVRLVFHKSGDLGELVKAVRAILDEGRTTEVADAC